MPLRRLPQLAPSPPDKRALLPGGEKTVGALLLQLRVAQLTLIVVQPQQPAQKSNDELLKQM